ncbi:diguanylate cyclase domain-containing protein [Shewanella sp. GXUN23E]|uniref:GGDEF domain-containing protein n=1 Tax=Shewanella sp. GXUN23E TaxID=3422498 RepID=UPI003D7E900B
MSFNSYHQRANKYLTRQQQALTSMADILLRQHIIYSERQLNNLEVLLNEHAISKGESVLDDGWPIVHQFRLDSSHHIYFYNAIKQVLEVYPDWTMPANFQVEQRPWYRLISQPDHDAHWIGPYIESDGATEVITLGKSQFDRNGNVMGALLVDIPLASIHEVVSSRTADKTVALILSNSLTGKPIVEFNTDKVQPLSAANTSPLQALRHGMSLTAKLDYVPWEIAVHTPPHHFREMLTRDFRFALMPISAIMFIALAGIYALYILLKRELVNLSTEIIGQDDIPSSKIAPLWLFKKEIATIKSHIKLQNRHIRLDGLTNILNRKAFEDDIQKLTATSQACVLMLLDVDNFKTINDRWGHQFGDCVLRSVAAMLAGEIGAEQVYRFGGDEFAALFPAKEQDIACLCDTLLEKCRHHDWPIADCQVSLSIGVAIGTASVSRSALLFGADSALYRSKHAGRNCWHINQGSPEQTFDDSEDCRQHAS